MSTSPTRSIFTLRAGGLLVALATALVFGYQPAARADDQDTIQYRQLIMKQLDSGSAVLGMMVSGQVPPDSLALQCRALAANAKMALKAFEPKVPGGNSKPEVWAKWDDFKQKMETFAKKSEEMAKAAEGGDVGTVTGLMVDALPCKQCHDIYRNKK